MPPSWKDSLFKKLSQLKQHNSTGLPRICLIGVGNDLRGDDSVGLIVVRRLSTDEYFNSAPNLLILEGGPAPENHTSKLRAFQPELVLFVDAAHLEESPGTIQLIPLESIDGMSASSHSLPLSVLARYIIAEFGSQVDVLGIQPAQNEVGADLSTALLTAVDEVVCLMCDLLKRS